jgi:hypothetical protein
VKPESLFPAFRISKPVALLLAFLISASVLSVIGIVSSTALSAQQNEREFKNKGLMKLRELERMLPQ